MQQRPEQPTSIRSAPQSHPSLVLELELEAGLQLRLRIQQRIGFQMQQRAEQSACSSGTQADVTARPLLTAGEERLSSPHMGTPPPDAIKRLVDRFDQDRKVFLSCDYKEEQLRAEFLNPFFAALGWDMDNREGLSETFKQIIHEESIKVAGASKAPDYTFRIGGRHKASCC